MNTIFMDYFEYNQSSSSASSSPLQITSSPKILTPTTPHHKKKAGRKVFKETRHPVYRGVRRKNRSKWVCEVREPNKKSRIWLGTFPNPEAAAVAHDVAALALRGENAPLNFPESVALLPRAQSSSRYDIQRAALGAARDLIPSFRFSEEENSSNSSIEKNDIETGGCGGGGGEGFVDEEAVFNMPVLLDSMAEGMLITPLGMKKGFSWSQYEADEGLEINLWGN